MKKRIISFEHARHNAKCHCCSKPLKNLRAIRFYSYKLTGFQFICSSCLKLMEQCRKNVEEL